MESFQVDYVSGAARGPRGHVSIELCTSYIYSLRNAGENGCMTFYRLGVVI